MLHRDTEISCPLYIRYEKEKIFKSDASKDIVENNSNKNLFSANIVLCDTMIPFQTRGLVAIQLHNKKIE